MSNNPYQNWYYNPVTGILRSQKDGRCVRVVNDEFVMDDDCSTSRHTQFIFKDNGLYNPNNGYCISCNDLDRRSASCSDSDAALIFESDLGWSTT